MARTPQELVLLLRKRCSELRTIEDAGLRAKAIDDIDKLLDERLEMRGAHPPECDCDDCIEAVRQALAHRLGEAIGDDDTASIMDWGHAG